MRQSGTTPLQPAKQHADGNDRPLVTEMPDTAFNALPDPPNFFQANYGYWLASRDVIFD